MPQRWPPPKEACPPDIEFPEKLLWLARLLGILIEVPDAPKEPLAGNVLPVESELDKGGGLVRGRG